MTFQLSSSGPAWYGHEQPWPVISVSSHLRSFMSKSYQKLQFPIVRHMTVCTETTPRITFIYCRPWICDSRPRMLAQPETSRLEWWKVVQCLAQMCRHPSVGESSTPTSARVVTPSKRGMTSARPLVRANGETWNGSIYTMLSDRDMEQPLTPISHNCH